ncbi:crotonase/enoyl-CoA hydratase family protein [Faunimonas sp. B44]|uniref:crotonase/enoyl-CoA hydratase family protein n=1 Tax=Faunimonas sp. B44 TaxID=3461493 RepID=UPI00404480A2
MGTDADVEIRCEGAVLVLRMARPDKKNALTVAMYEAMAHAIEAATGDDEIAAAVILGCGGTFTAGNDIADFLAGPEGDRLAGVVRFLKAVVRLDRPLIAAVDGLAVGIGTTILLHCDYVLATERSTFHTPFVQLGLVPEAASSLLAPRLMGHARAFELLVMGRPFGAVQARDAGFVNGLAAPDRIEEEALGVARELAARPRAAMLASRRLLKGEITETLDRIDEEVDLFREFLQSSEARAAFQSFLGRRK